jgi:hypothetical protein
VLDPGAADILFGTPPALVHGALHAIMARLETIYSRQRTDFFLVRPVLPPGLRARGRAYLGIFDRVAEERHLHVIRPGEVIGPGAWGAAGERLLPDEAARRRRARLLAEECDTRPIRRLLRGGVWGLAVFLILFLAIQMRTRRRLRRLVEISCTPAESEAGSEPRG